MQNLSHNNDDDSQVDEQDKSRQKSALQRDMIMAETDFNKYNNEKVQLEAEIRALKKEEARLKVDLQEKQTRLSRVENELMQLDGSLKSLKKKLNLI